ncbi:MAG TPA: PIN domain-containing protein [Candidatus Methylacidiphilales bacterium]|nr:PIN domain-containing protein [Candidatus Methylacidiphilales bacterium]
MFLLDTGPVVAFFDPDDAEHARVSKFMVKLVKSSGQFVTTSAVIAEAMYFLQAVNGGPARFVQFLGFTQTRVLDFSSTTDLQRAVELMTRYADTPMDFADATLILAAEKVRTNRICTIDLRGFTVFRTISGRPFNLDLENEA